MTNIINDLDINQKIINIHHPFEGPLLAQIKNFYRVSHVYTSNALEGFSYTENETAILLEDGLTAGGKPIRDMYAVWARRRPITTCIPYLKKRP